MANIRNTCAAALSTMTNFMQVQLNPQNPDAEKQPKYKSQVYQVFGFDVLIDKKLKAWLLEINDHPSMNIIHCTDAGAMGCDHKECPMSRVDLHVKA